MKCLTKPGQTRWTKVYFCLLIFGIFCTSRFYIFR